MNASDCVSTSVSCIQGVETVFDLYSFGTFWLPVDEPVFQLFFYFEDEQHVCGHCDLHYFGGHGK